MDHQAGEDCIPVGSRGTLLSLMEKEMEILQARRSCSVSYSNMNYNQSPSAKNPNTLQYASDVFGCPASPLMNPPSTSIVSSLWSDLKGLLRSPTSIHHSPLVYHNIAQYSPLIYGNNAHFCKELEIIEGSAGASTFCEKSPPKASKSPLRTHSHPSPRRTYPKKEVGNSPAQITSPYSSKEMHPKGGSPDYPHGKSCPLQNYPPAGAADHPNRKSPPLPSHSHARSAIAYSNRKDTDVYQVLPTGFHDQEARKCNRPKEPSLAGAASVNPNLQYPKQKAMDSENPNLQHPTYPKAKAMDAVYAMRRRLGSTSRDGDHSQNGMEEAKGSASRKREDRRICSSREDEYCMQKRDERESLQREYEKEEERECMEERGSRMQHEYECFMQKPMLEDMEKGPCTPASSPVNMRSPPCFKPSRSFGGRSLAPVSVVDLQCCHTPTSREPSSRRLLCTRLSSF